MVYDVSNMLMRTQILFPEDILESLRSEATSKKVSVSNLVRGIVTEKFKSTRKRKLSGVDVMVKMARHAYKGNLPPDFSTNDDYLYKLP